MNFGFIIDNRKCIGCHACTVACKSEHDVPIGVNRTWVKYIEKGNFPNSRRLFAVMRCNHCADAPCVDICPVTALHYRDDGIIDFDNRRCIGCKACVQACPYNAIFIDPETNTAAKCNYCAHRVEIGLEPACVNTCPEQAIISGDLDDPYSEISVLLAREAVTARKVEKGTRPKLFYIEGDAALLQPGVAGPSDSYLWNSQAAGVGHFAKNADTQISQHRLENSAAPMDPGLAEALSTVERSTRRVYDTPDKGTLWGWEVSGYVWTKAISTGAFLVPFLATVTGLATVSSLIWWTGIVLALLFLLITSLILIKDLDQPARFAYLILRPQWGSWVVRGGYIVMVYGIMLALWAAAKLLNRPELEAPALWGGGIFAILTTVYTAFLFAQAKGRDFWQSPMFFLHLLGHTFMAGAAVFAIFGFVAGSNAMWDWYLRYILSVGIFFNLLILVLELATPHPTVDAKMTVQLILQGRFKSAFWGGTVLLGNILPLPLTWIGSPETLASAGFLVLLGLYVTEHVWVQAPQRVPLS